MVDIAAISGAVGSIKAAGYIANAMLKLRDAQALQEKTIELNRLILSAQSDAINATGAQTELIHEIRELKEEIGRLKNWETEMQRYQLAELAPGLIAMAIKDAMRNGEPFHYICANCCSNGRKSYLQHTVRGSHYNKFECNSCEEELSYSTDAGAPMRRSYSPRGGGPDGWMGN